MRTMAHAAPMSASPTFRSLTAQTHSESIDWAVDSPAPSVQNVGVNHCSADIAMAEQLMDRPVT